MENFLEEPFWESEYKELLVIFQRNLTLPFPERDRSVLEEIEILRQFVEKKIGINYITFERMMFDQYQV